MSNRSAKLAASIALACCTAQASAQQVTAPNPLDWKKPGLIELAVVSFIGADGFADELKTGMMAVDQRADGRLQLGANEIDDLEVMVVFARDWANAGFVNAGLFANLDLRDHLAAKEGSDSWIDLQFVESSYYPDIYVLFVLAAFEGQPVPDDCLAQAAVTTLYQGKIEPVFDMAGCIGVSR